jgi:hypothetical protein
MWNEKGERIIHGVGNISKDICLNLTLSTLEWLERFNGDTVDYFLEQHSLDTLRILQRLKDLEFLKTILEVNGPTRQTRFQSKRHLVLGNDKDGLQEIPIGRNDNEAGPSGTANDTV